MPVTPPWRMERRKQFPGLPAWSMPAEVHHEAAFDIDLFPGVDAEWAWGGVDGEGVRVCLLDSGVDGSHPRVAPIEKAWQVAHDGERGLQVEECEPQDSAGHGTACAGIIRSVAPQASVSSIRVLTDGKSGTGAALIAGLEHAVNEGFDVINMSLSTPRPEFRSRLAELADLAYFRRCVLVVSAHNLPITSYPWNFSSVISVASHDEDDPMRFYYNATPPVDFHARGVRVPVAQPGGREIRSTGNSFAAPHIAGIAALILSKHPGLTPFQLKSVLYHCSSNVVAMREGGLDRVG
jgi:subtilisin